MLPFDAKKVLEKFRLFRFDRLAEDLLNRFHGHFSRGDPYEDQFRANLASVSAGEFAVLRDILSGDYSYKANRRVYIGDVQLATMTADTLRTRPCLTVRNFLEGGALRTEDLFMFSGDAAKMAKVLADANLPAAEFRTPAQFASLGQDLYRAETAKWEPNELQDLYRAKFDALSIMFAYLRMATAKNIDTGVVIREFDELIGALGAVPEAAAGWGA